jgi:hypothetical protein
MKKQTDILIVDEIEYVSANFEVTTDFAILGKIINFQKLNLIWCFIRKLKILKWKS